MKEGKYLFTSESVTEGHPDKICDQISDAILDAILKDDKNGRVAIETLVTTGLCIIVGEIKTRTYVNVEQIAREVIKDIGYTKVEIITIEDNPAHIQKIRWEFEKDILTKEFKELYDNLHKYPEPILKFLYALQRSALIMLAP